MAGQRLSLLMRGELWLAPEMHAARPGPLPAVARARPDQLPLELGEAAQVSFWDRKPLLY